MHKTYEQKRKRLNPLLMLEVKFSLIFCREHCEKKGLCREWIVTAVKLVKPQLTAALPIGAEIFELVPSCYTRKRA